MYNTFLGSRLQRAQLQEHGPIVGYTAHWIGTQAGVYEYHALVNK